MTAYGQASPSGDHPTSAKNDEAILRALATLENPLERKKLKLTVDAICVLTGLSVNTIRSREWALERLKKIKRDAKTKAESVEVSAFLGDVLEEVPTLDALRDRIRKLLNQNALLFEEIMSLRAEVKKRDEALLAIHGKRLTVL